MSDQKQRLHLSTTTFIRIASIGIPSTDGLTSRLSTFAVGLLIVLLQSLMQSSVSAWSQENANATPTGKPTKESLPESRQPWTTSRVVGSPEPPPPFKSVRAFPNLKFEHPLHLVSALSTNRLFVAEQAGVIYSFINRADAAAELFIDLRQEIKTLHLNASAHEVEAVYGLVFHPQFEQNRQCFICYTLRQRDNPNLTDGTRVSRFTVTNTDPPRADPLSEEIVLTFLQGGHNGCDLHFGPDGFLYISTGDGSNPNPPDALNTGQDVSDLLSSILRIDVDHKDEGKSYAVPKDNPFVTTKGARPEVWAYGFRNPWRMSFDSTSGGLFVGDVGWELWESVCRVERGGNYGWAAMEGPQSIKPEKVGPTPLRPPLIALPHAIATSVTGGYVYRGSKFPELMGAYVFGDFESRRMWSARFEGDKVKEMTELTSPSVRISSFGLDNFGELYFLDYDNGSIHTLERNDADQNNLQFPKSLSETGLFASVLDHAPAQGVVSFQPIAEQWQDGATSDRWAAFPNLSAATLHPVGKMIPGITDWHRARVHFPKDGVLLKTISLGGRRIETQLLHFDGTEWRGYSYAWREDQSDADLVPRDGTEKEITVADQRHIWQFHSRNQCLSCHNGWSEFSLAFHPDQLNRFDQDGRNQLQTLTQAEYIRRVNIDGKTLPAFDTDSIAKESSLCSPSDGSQPLANRARSYLHANCGHCHREGGGGAVPLRMQANTSDEELKAIGVRPSRGDFGLPGAQIIKAGDPHSSTLYYRMSKFGRDRMPHLGSDLPDEAGLKLIGDWITQLGPSRESKKVNQYLPEDWMTNPATAMIAARKLGTGEMSPSDREKLLGSIAKLPAGTTRDFFEGYLPQGERGERKLGTSPRPNLILALQGDATRGETLFWSKAINCSSCHKIGDRGTNIGPDLSTIGKLRTREDLLESILTPSRRIEPEHATYIVRLDDGKVLSGLLVERNESTITLVDAQNKMVTTVVAEVEEFRSSQLSMMPDGQLAGSTAQECADLVQYLAERK
ncbi:MAG: PQQ-dependent sugar dehydrogenase [Pirellula sp.]